MDLGIDGKAALVTGASGGLGRAIATALAAEGARVALSGRSRERIDAAAADVGGVALVWDSADADGAAGLLDAAGEALGGAVEILVVNTGGPPAGPPLSHDRAAWEDAYRSLVLGPVTLVQAALPAMRDHGWGRIVNVVGTTVREPNPPLLLSSSHRAAMITTFKTLAREVAADGVTLNSLLPGRIHTDRLESLFGTAEAIEAMARDEIPAGRAGTAEEFAAAAAFLCSGPASYITGETLAVDGGFTRSVF
jgi:3-oxoacyl-[acyl-carrier protein] reductase